MVVLSCAPAARPNDRDRWVMVDVVLSLDTVRAFGDGICSAPYSERSSTKTSCFSSSYGITSWGATADFTSRRAFLRLIVSDRAIKFGGRAFPAPIKVARRLKFPGKLNLANRRGARFSSGPNAIPGKGSTSLV